MIQKENGRYILKRGKWYHYKKRVPLEYRDKFKKEFFVTPLNTDSISIATSRAKSINRLIDDYLLTLIEAPDHDSLRFKEAVKLLRMRGFTYKTYNEVIDRHC